MVQMTQDAILKKNALGPIDSHMVTATHLEKITQVPIVVKADEVCSGFLTNSYQTFYPVYTVDISLSCIIFDPP
jgi:hypothetical protein